MGFYRRKIKIPEEVIEGLREAGLEGECSPEYLVEPEPSARVPRGVGRPGLDQRWSKRCSARLDRGWPVPSPASSCRREG
jgi:hypothetical protein